MENKKCRLCGENFIVTDHELQLRNKLSPEFAGKKFPIPSPNDCPDCRLKQRLSYRAGNKFFSRKCDLTGKPIVSMYSPEKTFKVYEHDAWWSDQWDAMQYGRDFDFSRPLYDQLFKLFSDVPHAALLNTNTENSYYTNHGLNLKNCYLVTGVAESEDVMYGYFTIGCKDVLDSASLTNCQYCYEGLTSGDCYLCKYFSNCRNCTECMMVEDCQGCTNCIGCFGLKNKQYYIYNQNVGKESYEKFVRENLTPLTHAKIESIHQKFNEIKIKLPHRHAYLYSCEDCTGDLVFNSKNCIWAFGTTQGEDSAYTFSSSQAINLCDCSFSGGKVGAQYSCNTLSTIGQKFLFSWIHWLGNSSIFTMECHSCTDCFACVGLKNKQYCVFNKQYTKEEYESLAAKILEHMQKTNEWGEFFSPAKSPYAYNESVAQDYFPLEKNEAIAKGFVWSEYEPPKPNTEKIIKTSDLPEDIAQAGQDVISSAIECGVTGRPFIITPNEFAFYKEQGIPLPRKHPEQRHKERMAIRNPIRLWPRKCSSCNKEIMSIYAPDRPEIVYCESCYQKLVI